jgi:uncharacterized membrane protein
MPLLMIYPLLAHLAVLGHDTRLQWLALMLLGTAPLFGALLRHRWWAYVGVLALGSVLYFVVTAGGGAYAMLFPPVLIPVALGVVFAKTLKRGETPMITRIARAMRGSLSPELEIYTRRVTIVWVAMFVALTASAIALALWARPEIWSLGTNLVHYLVLGALFVGEYIYRRIRFRKHAHESLATYLRKLAKVNLRTR